MKDTRNQFEADVMRVNTVLGCIMKCTRSEYSYTDPTYDMMYRIWKEKQGWLPMESAPKDGTTILVLINGQTSMARRKLEFENPGEFVWEFIDHNGGMMIMNGIRDNNFRGWKPI